MSVPLFIVGARPEYRLCGGVQASGVERFRPVSDTSRESKQATFRTYSLHRLDQGEDYDVNKLLADCHCLPVCCVFFMIRIARRGCSVPGPRIVSCGDASTHLQGSSPLAGGLWPSA